MHLIDGVLPLIVTILFTLIAVVFVLAGLRVIRIWSREVPSTIPFTALIGALVFVASSVLIPVPPTSVHMLGTPLAGIVLGPLPAVVITAITLLIQLFVLGDGGLTTLGVNVFNMGILGSTGGYLAFRLLRKLGLPLWLSGMVAAMAGNVATYLSVAAMIAWSSDPSMLAAELPILTLGIFSWQGFFLVLEALITGITLQYVSTQMRQLDEVKLDWRKLIPWT